MVEFQSGPSPYVLFSYFLHFLCTLIARIDSLYVSLTPNISTRLAPVGLGNSVPWIVGYRPSPTTCGWQRQIGLRGNIRNDSPQILCLWGPAKVRICGDPSSGGWPACVSILGSSLQATIFEVCWGNFGGAFQTV